ncbi:MAG: iron complex outermembrane receptor protein, partial [Kiritimatiellia bacterium]
MERNMQRRIPHKRNLLCAAISISLLPLASHSIAQQDTVEEVVVTGSYIRRSEGFTGASSIVQLNAEDLEAEGTLNIGEVIQNLAFVQGDASAITNTIQGQNSRSSSVDLRGLGASSTLTLLDGKRLVNQNVNALIPTIAIQRLDIVADGAAALYGNEAVAGVVNFVPYKSYDGFKMDTFAEQDTRGDYDEHSVQMMWGGEIGPIDVVVAG